MPLRSIQLVTKINPRITIEPDVNIGYAAPGVVPVPELETRQAAVFVLCSWKEWQKLSWQDRAVAVAHYRMHLLIDAHMADAAEKQSASNRPQMEPNGFARR